MDNLLNAFKAHTANQDQSNGVARFGTITSVDPATATARVTLQPEGVLTGWLPLLTPWVGNGWGIACPPVVGTQVFVLPQEGDAEQGIIIGATWSMHTKPPAASPGEIWLVHQSGSFLKLLNDGTVQVKGDLHVMGNIYDTHGSLSALRGHYNSHAHPPQTSLTTQPD